MLAGLSTIVAVPVVPNRHQTDRFLIVCRNPNNTPLTVIGAPGQLLDLQRWQNSSGTVVTNIDSAGNLITSVAVSATGNVYGAAFYCNGVNGLFSTTTAGTSKFTLTNTTTTNNCFAAIGQNVVFNSGDNDHNTLNVMFMSSGTTPIRGITNTAANAFTFDTGNYLLILGGYYSSTPPAGGTISGCYGTGTNVNGTSIYVQPGGSTGNASTSGVVLRCNVPTTSGGTAQATANVLTISGTTQNALVSCSGATLVGLVVKGAASQSANLQEWQKSDSTVYYKLDKLARPVTSNTTPTIAAGTGAGTSPTISITGTDVNGVVTLTSGTLPTGAAVVATITFSSAFGATPKTVMLTPANANAAALNALTMVWVDSAGLTTTTWTINAGATGLGAATAYVWYYQVLG